jgi:3-oxoacyl-[acyl-carrier-protein] synthase-3
MFGITAFGTALGEPSPVAEVVSAYSEDVERILGYGYASVYRAPDDVLVSDLATAAAQRALAAGGTSPDDVDLLVLALTDIPEYLYWDAAAALQHRLGLRCESVLVTQACTGALSGLDLIAGRFATHASYRTALLVAANRCCDAYWNRMQTQSMVFSDGAVAAVAVRDHGASRWLASHAITDGRFASLYRMDVGGGAVPFRPGITQQPGASDAWDIMEFFDYDDERLAAFTRLIDTRMREVVDDACAAAGVKRSELRYVVLLHDNRRAITSLAKTLEVPLARTNAEISLATGHLGAADQLFSLDKALAAGTVGPGDLVALTGLGRGMHWACTLLEI